MSHLPLFTCYSFTALSNADLIDMHDVARSMLLHEDFILDHKKGRVLFQTEEAIPFEPYALTLAFLFVISNVDVVVLLLMMLWALLLLLFSLSQCPTVKQLLRALRKVNDWHQLGLLLGLEMSTLEACALPSTIVVNGHKVKILALHLYVVRKVK